jgi:lipopolysaccharide biosynthesis protein
VNRIFKSLIGKKRASLRPNFFAGSMFWFKPAALSPFVSQLLAQNNYIFEPELGQRDGTLAHVIERMFCDVVESQGQIVSSTMAPSKPLDKSKSRLNRIIIDSDQPLETSLWLLGEIYRTAYKFLSSKLKTLT